MPWSWSVGRQSPIPREILPGRFGRTGKPLSFGASTGAPARQTGFLVLQRARRRVKQDRENYVPASFFRNGQVDVRSKSAGAEAPHSQAVLGTSEVVPGCKAALETCTKEAGFCRVDDARPASGACGLCSGRSG